MLVSTEHPNPAELMRENLRLRGALLTVASRVSHDLRPPSAISLPRAIS